MHVQVNIKVSSNHWYVVPAEGHLFVRTDVTPLEYQLKRQCETYWGDYVSLDDSAVDLERC